MDKDTRHIQHEYDEELTQLHDRVREMTGKVETIIANAIKSLIEKDVGLAKRNMDADTEVDRYEIDIDRLCLVILATRQPVARDLRFIATAFKIVTDLERISDLAVGISSRAIELADLPQPKTYQDIPRMAELTQSMIHKAITAYLDEDTELAHEVCAMDDEVDELYRRVVRDLLPIMSTNREFVEPGFHVQTIAKLLERMGDHATNIAEQVVFMVEAKDIRHSG